MDDIERSMWGDPKRACAECAALRAEVERLTVERDRAVEAMRYNAERLYAERLYAERDKWPSDNA
jgi:hypothetical protein